jgi:hypothetical protein
LARAAVWLVIALTVPLDWLNEHALELESSFFGAR